MQQPLRYECVLSEVLLSKKIGKRALTGRLETEAGDALSTLFWMEVARTRRTERMEEACARLLDSAFELPAVAVYRKTALEKLTFQIEQLGGGSGRCVGVSVAKDRGGCDCGGHVKNGGDRRRGCKQNGFREPTKRCELEEFCYGYKRVVRC